MKLEQVFYGNVGSGYKILGASDSSYSHKVEQICMAFGSPDGISEVSPFLISVPDGDSLFMACCRLGRPDGVGRKTLFFHVLVGNRKEAIISGINAFSLFAKNVFCGKIPLGKIDSLSVAHERGQAFPPEWDGVPVAIRTKCPVNDLLQKMVGNRVNDIAWAAFSFRPLDSQYKIYAISRYAERPKDRRCRDEDRVTEVPHPIAEAEPVKKSDSVEPKKQRPMALYAVLALSVLANIYFVMKFSPEVPNTKSQVVVAPEITAEQRAQILEEGRQKTLEDLRDSLPSEDRIRNLEEGLPSFVREKWKERKNKGLVQFFDKLERYVCWVNSEIFAEKSEAQGEAK